MCKDCGKGFRDGFLLNAHMNTFRGKCHKHHVCPNCYRDFKKASSLESHACSHSGTQRDLLKLEKQGERVKASNSTPPSNLKAPFEHHKRDKIIPCSNCVKGFFQPADIAAHLSVVRGKETVYSECYFCIRGFMKISDMKLHMTTHENGKFCQCYLKFCHCI